MEILNNEIEKEIQNNIIQPLDSGDYDQALKHIPIIIDELYANIPDNKRISYGRVHTIKVLTKYIHSQLQQRDMPIFKIATEMFGLSDDFRSKGVALGIISYIGLEDFESVLPYFKAAAASKNWDVREFAQMFFRKLIKKHPDKAKKFLLKQVSSNNPNIRRFVSETLRPVQENKWFYKEPEHSLSILKNMFKESAAYPRTSVGNNLSDLARHLPEHVYKIVEGLVASGDKNSYWIAYRACRNLIKTEPIKVMDILKVDEYKYKQRKYKRSNSK